MAAPEPVTEYKQLVDKWLLELDGVKAGKMFGCPGYYAKGKLAVCHYGQYFFVKLPAKRISELVLTDPYCRREGPMGSRRSMGKEWMFMDVPTLLMLKKRKALFIESVTFLLSRDI
jgi:hypothetical protein